MTRDERIAAGWVECWGVFDLTACEWHLAGNGWRSGRTGKRTNWTFSEAHQRATYEQCNEIAKVVVRRFWRRKKPKAPPPLQVGDEVVVRGKVSNMVGGLPVGLQEVTLGSGTIIRCFKSELERVKP